MDPRTKKTFCDVLLLGAMFVAAGSMAGLWLPPGAALLLLAVVLCRICWIEDNIHHDLLPAKRMPPGYRGSRADRGGVSGAAALTVRGDPDCPQRLAAELRLQAHAWAAFAWGAAGGVVMQAAVPLTLVAGAATIFLALRQADYLALGSATLAARGSLPERLIAARGPLSHFAVIRRGPD
jgi:hypothetical protein